MKKLLIFSVLTVLLSSTYLFADCPPECATCVSGITNEHWTVEGSPYCVEGDILVANLVIEPGVTVKFIGNYVFEVAGLLTAVGTEEDPITFTREENNTTGWQGIYFHESNYNSELVYCTIEGSVNSGIRIVDSLPKIENCTIKNNSASQGGGINIYLSTLFPASELILKDCKFTDNTSSSHAGALLVSMDEGHKLIISNSLFEKNTANPSLANGNYVGGALYILQGDAVISNTLFRANRSNSRCTSGGTCDVLSRGGAIYIGGTGSSAMLENCEFLENMAYAQNNGYCSYGYSYSYGGGVYVNSGTVTLTNNMLSGNTTIRSSCSPSDGGGGLYVNGGAVTVVNSTIVKNPDATGVHIAGGTLEIMNSIIYFNNGEGAQVGGNPTITYSDVQGCYGGEGNICQHPILNECNQIVPFSPCIDKGHPDPNYNDVCLPPSLGTVRNDMGAHGGPGACEWIYCNGDFDKDCDIDGSDLSFFAADFGRTDCGDDCEGDFDNDGDVDGSDLAVFAANFGKTDCCPKSNK